MIWICIACVYLLKIFIQGCIQHGDKATQLKPGGLYINHIFLNISYDK